MKSTHCTDSQFIAILKLAESGASVAELCREHGMSYVCVYQWRSGFGEMDASTIACLKNWKTKTAGMSYCQDKKSP